MTVLSLPAMAHHPVAYTKIQHVIATTLDARSMLRKADGAR
jgi:hypothetical protein